MFISFFSVCVCYEDVRKLFCLFGFPIFCYSNLDARTSACFVCFSFVYKMEGRVAFLICLDRDLLNEFISLCLGSGSYYEDGRCDVDSSPTAFCLYVNYRVRR